MKKLFLSLLVASSFSMYAQKTINMFNYTSYIVTNSFGGGDIGTYSCLPLIESRNTIPPGGTAIYTGYYNSHIPPATNPSNPPIDSWMVKLGAGNAVPQPSTSPMLIPLGSSTDWVLNKFGITDPNSGTFYGGDTVGGGCYNNPVITQVNSSPSSPVTYQAVWFTAGGQTYFVIQ
ncbi:hypothetical protein [Chryseobacterium artocarpi]|uniref:hypothetical protein n=1 Tax=Chryseobacterium artocarpi TaxID=1414727 RepID=UPI003F397DC0